MVKLNFQQDAQMIESRAAQEGQQVEVEEEVEGRIREALASSQDVQMEEFRVAIPVSSFSSL